tara:strand:- start:68 stop:382 length:315 start_codon:yes stop_codon:yes gene_type:complete
MLRIISEIILSILFLVITIIFTFKKRYKLLVSLMEKKIFIISIIIISVFSFYTLNLDNKSEEVAKLQHAVKQALLGLIIALMAHLDLVIAPFWAIFLASYYLGV